MCRIYTGNPERVTTHDAGSTCPAYRGAFLFEGMTMRFPGIVLAVLLLSACTATWEREVTARAQKAADDKAATSERLYCNTQSTGWFLRQPEPRRKAFTDYCGYLGYGGEGSPPATPAPGGQ